MNLMEYQGKELFKRSGIPVPQSRHAVTADQVKEFVGKTPGDWVIKAQVLMGGRGKAGKIKFAKSAEEGHKAATDILSSPMPPNRQNPNGEPINSLLVEAKLDIAKEAYAAIAIDRTTKKPVIMVSRFGGMDIEEVSEKHPESIAKHYVDTAIGYSPFIGRELAFAAELDPGYYKQLPGILGSLYEMFFATARNWSRSIRSRSRRKASSLRRMQRSNSTTTDSSARRSSKSGTRRCRWTKTNRSLRTPA